MYNRDKIAPDVVGKYMYDRDKIAPDVVGKLFVFV
jgi:hypothetical protein